MSTIKQMLSEKEVILAAWVNPDNATTTPVDSDSAIEVLTPILGPSATLFLHWMGREFNHGTWVMITPVDEIAGRLGLGTARGQVASMLERLQRFGFIRVLNEVRIEVRTMVPKLSGRLQLKIPECVAGRYTAIHNGG